MRGDIKTSLVLSPMFGGVILAALIWTNGWENVFDPERTRDVIILLVLLFSGSFIFMLIMVRRHNQEREKRKLGGEGDVKESDGGSS